MKRNSDIFIKVLSLGVGLSVGIVLIARVFFYLQQFAHRVGFYPSVFLLTLGIVGLLCASVVLYHYCKTARMNPVRTLKHE